VRTGSDRARAAVATLLTVALGLTLSACGGSGNGDVTLTVGSRSIPEQVILGQIYAQALEGAGYRVKKKLDLGAEIIWPWEELKQHRISGYPEHVNTALESFAGVELADIPGNPEEAYRKAKAALGKEGVTVFPPTPFARTDAVGMLKKTADRRKLKTVSDLKGKSEQMTLLGPVVCHVRLDCLGGLETYYGIVFGGYSNVDPHRRYEVLENGESDASILPSTDGRLAAEKNRFVILEEDGHALPAGNALFVTTPTVVEEAGPDYEETIATVQKSLTLPVMQKLDAQVEIEKKPPAKVAAQYLKSIGYNG
jgi:glycine betaine/choline ABC-type transport system substrate-binding protein